MVRILVVDDDETLARAIKRMLAFTGRFEITVETNPHIAIARIIETAQNHERFDIVLCDSRMPGASGNDVLRAVRSHTEAPFILMSGEDELDGADARLVKPFTRDELLHTIDELTLRPNAGWRCAP